VRTGLAILWRTLRGVAVVIAASPVVAWFVTFLFGWSEADVVTAAFGSAAYALGMAVGLSWFWAPILAAVAGSWTALSTRHHRLGRTAVTLPIALVAGASIGIFAARVLSREAAISGGIAMGLGVASAIGVGRPRRETSEGDGIRRGN
jgi:hypothetical protein